jgi:hypothetical protein
VDRVEIYHTRSAPFLQDAQAAIQQIEHLADLPDHRRLCLPLITQWRRERRGGLQALVYLLRGAEQRPQRTQRRQIMRAWVRSFSGFLASCGALCNPALAIDCASFSRPPQSTPVSNV